MKVTKFQAMLFSLLCVLVLFIISGGLVVSCDGPNAATAGKEHNLNITGIIVDATDKAPVEGVYAAVWVTEKATQVNLATDTSDINGKYRLGCAYDCLQLLRLRFEAEGYVTYVSNVIPCQTTAQTFNAELQRVQ